MEGWTTLKEGMHRGGFASSLSGLPSLDYAGNDLSERGVGEFFHLSTEKALMPSLMSW